MPFGTTVAKFQRRQVNYLIQGWEAGGVLTVESGPPFTPVVAGNVSGADEINNATVQEGVPMDTDRPNLVSRNFYPSHQTPQEWVQSSAFSTPSAFTFGNAGRNILRGPGLGSCDFSILRNFRLNENAKVQFRAEVFNIFNRANFDIPRKYRKLRQLRPNFQYRSAGRRACLRRAGGAARVAARIVADLVGS